jgi:hypothetical protein
MENEKAITKIWEIILKLDDFNSAANWESEKKFIKYIIEQHINNAYMIDQRYYKEYINLYHDMLTNLNEL